MTVNGIIAKVKRTLSQLRGLLPERLPVGVTEFNNFVDSIIDLYSPPCDRRSARFIVATLIMRLGPTEAFKSKIYFVLSMTRGAASQVSVHIMEQIKMEQAEEAAQAKAQQEATKSLEASNVQSV